MPPAKQPKSERVRPGQGAFLGAALGGFIGLLLGKFALGLIFGFFAGIMVGAFKHKASAPGSERPPEDRANE